VTMRANPELAALPAGSTCVATSGGDGGGSVKEFKKYDAGPCSPRRVRVVARYAI